MKLNLKLHAVLVALSICGVAQAGTRCTGTIDYLGLHSDGSVWVELKGATFINSVCNTITQGTNKVDAQTCKAVYASMLTARTAGLNVGFNYDASVTCASIKAWSYQPTFYFFEING